MIETPEWKHSSSASEKFWWKALLAATAANCLLQIAWFWRFRAHDVVMDGIEYIGVARHLVDGNVKASLHGYWSPLTSWIIAGTAIFGRNFTLLGHLVTIASFLLCLPLLYWLTYELWRSRVAAALAVFWFSTSRGMVEDSVGSILADFVLTACVLLYFTLLLRALRRNRQADWLRLGGAHALAFLAKAIAMPWLAISTVIAVLARSVFAQSVFAQNVRPRRFVSSLLLAFVLPAAVWSAWGLALRTKYGQFTPGYQLRANLMTNWNRKLSHHARGDNLAFVDTSSVYDEYMVAEFWPRVRSFHEPATDLLPMMIATEFHNLPAAVKEILILLNPGGVLALGAMLMVLIGTRAQHQAETALAGIVVVSLLALIAAYCMLVFDARYVIPIVPVLIALACPMLLPATLLPATMLPTSLAPDVPHAPRWLQKTALGLFVAGTIFFSLYWASPFRTVDRDFEVSCYRAADFLRDAKAHGTLVSLGSGPYPDHGVGFEAAPYTAYMAGWRTVGENSELPELAGADELTNQALAMKADAVLVWGSPANPAYAHIVQAIQRAPGFSSANKVTDPFKGEVGTAALFRRDDPAVSP